MSNPLKPETVSDNESYDEEDDQDFVPDVAGPRAEEEAKSESDDDDNEEVPDYSAVESSDGQSLVRTRNQTRDAQETKNTYNGLVSAPRTSVDVDDLFALMRNQSTTRTELVLSRNEDESDAKRQKISSQKENFTSTNTNNTTDVKQTGSEEKLSAQPEMIQIETSYTFAGKLIKETKLVEAGSEEAKAYLNSTGNIIRDNDKERNGNEVPIVREINGEKLQLRIKLMRPSLIDKFLATGKLQKLSTLEKSRLDWASFVDKRKLADDLKKHNKAGYLDKQDFLDRVALKENEQYKIAREEERKTRINEEKGSG